MGISRSNRRKGLYVGLLLVTGCAGIEPYEARDYREEGPERGIFSGADGEFVIYRKLDEPEAGSKAGKEPDQPVDGK